MQSQELRSAFVEFFTSREHKHVPSASLIPDAMSTTLFTIAGMEQFVPAFVGDEPPPALNAVTVQRCLRVAGAKSDIENVGRTGRHGTFLEMLGNFSFGGYYKREAIRYAWEFVTVTLGLDPARLAVTVHTNDDEAETIWREQIGLPPERITRFDEDNFWTMGPTGPCGPCTEIFYDSGAQNAVDAGDDGPNKGNRWVEIWNVVFQQYNRDAAGKLNSSRASRSTRAPDSNAFWPSSTARVRCTKPISLPTLSMRSRLSGPVRSPKKTGWSGATSSPIMRAR